MATSIPNRAASSRRSVPAVADTPVWGGGGVRIGTFRCPVDHPEFSTAGPIEGYTVFFPRSAVWIEREDCPPFVADPSVATIYNQGQPYLRKPLAREGDRGEWFSIGRELAVAIVKGLDPEGGVDAERPFPAAFGRVDADTYLRQRRLYQYVRRTAAPDALAVEEQVVLLIGRVLQRQCSPGRSGRRDDSRELVEAARAFLARDPLGSPTIRALASRLGGSPYHLCRMFRRVTGLTIHHYLLELRARLALERLESDHPVGQLAHEMGFSSHSHFSAAIRRRLGATPSELRRAFRSADHAGAAGTETDLTALSK